MFRFFGGVPRLVVPDNLKSGVHRASFDDPEINRSYGMMASHYGVGILPARPRKPRDILNGTNHFDFLATVTVSDFVETSRLRALGVTAPDRVAGLKDVPTVVEQGFPDLVVEDYVGFAVKSGTPGDIVATLNSAINKALQKQKVAETFAKLGATPAGGTAEAFGTLIKEQVAYWGKVIGESGIKTSR